MTLQEIIKGLNLEVITGGDNLNLEVKDGYTSDLLSDVMANAQSACLWITLQTHVNIVAVAKLKDLAGIIIVNGRQPDKETRQKAQEENLPLLLSKETAFQVSGRLYQLLGKGK
ncbi:MAG TPA: serine kinase [Candidatus Aminicenantes bacterium]|nr:serine kinase [Candidatus Aminicenantes bacterium]